MVERSRELMQTRRTRVGMAAGALICGLVPDERA